MHLIYKYLLKPTPISTSIEDPFALKVKLFLSAFFFLLTGILFWSVLVTIINKINVAISGDALLSNLLRNQQHSLQRNHSKFIYMIILMLLGPVYEELAFRLFLDLKRRSVIISVSLIIFFLWVPIWYLHLSKPITYLYIGILGLLLVLCYSLIKEGTIHKLRKMNFRVLFYASVLLFGFMHIFNFRPLTFTKVILTPILIFPQVIGGCALGYIRVKNGIGWSIFLHIIINSIGYLFIFYL